MSNKLAYLLVTLFVLSLSLIIMVQPARAAESVTIYAIQDTYVGETFPDTNRGSLDHMWCKKNESERAYAFIMFNITGIPQKAYIKATELRAKVSSLGIWETIIPNSVGVYLCTTNDWNENTLIWNNKPAIESESITTGASANNVGDWSSWEITDVINAGSELTIVLKAWNADTAYYTKESAYSPELTITYIPRGSITTIQIIIAVCAIGALGIIGIIIYIKRRKK